MSTCERLVRLCEGVEQIRYICEQHIHADRSISLEAQGFSEVECAEIIAEESLAKKVLETIQSQQVPTKQLERK